MTTLEILENHARVDNVSVEDGGDLIMVTLKAPWARYGTGRVDGYSKGFDAYDTPDGEPLTLAQNAKRALDWVRHDVTRDESAG